MGEVFFDQTFRGLFSALFGAGIVLLADRAEARGRRPVLLSLGRNALLLVIGGIDLTRTALPAFVLTGHRYGPVEWLWRSATHRRWQPLQRRYGA